MTASATNALPLDTATMRSAAERLLLPGASMPAGDDQLEALRLRLREQVESLIPQVEEAAAPLPRSDITREAALTCAGEGRMRLRLGPGDSLAVRIAVVQRLARSVRALCGYYDLLAGSERCASCDKPIERGEDSVEHDIVMPPAGAGAPGHLHARCVDTVRNTRR